MRKICTVGYRMQVCINNSHTTKNQENFTGELMALEVLLQRRVLVQVDNVLTAIEICESTKGCTWNIDLLGFTSKVFGLTHNLITKTVFAIKISLKICVKLRNLKINKTLKGISVVAVNLRASIREFLPAALFGEL